MRLSIRDYQKLIRRCIIPQLDKFAILFLLLLVGIGLMLLLPQLISHYVDVALEKNHYYVLVWIGAGYIGLTIVNQGIQLGETYLSEKVAWYATNTLRQDLAVHCLNLDMSFHKQHAAGEMIERIDGDVSELANFFSRFIIQIIGNILLLVGVICVLFYQNIWVGVAFFFFISLSLFVLNKVREFATPYWIKARQAKAQFFGDLGDWLSTMEDVRPNGGVPHIMKRFYFSTRELFFKERTAYIRSRSLWPAMIILFAFGYALVFMMGTYLLKSGAITLGVLFLMFYYMDAIRAPLEHITMEMEDFQKSNASIKRILELFSYSSEIIQESDEELPNGALSIEFRNVTFAYQEGKPVLNNISFSLKAGEKLGLIGRTGSGKSTLVNVLLRLFEFSSGEILLGGKSIKRILLEALNERVAIVNQEPQLFHASIRDNITMFQPHIPDDQIIQALREVGLESWLKDLSHGLDTILTSGGKELSAGQAQLLALARVFLRDPGLVILDEASSRLDYQTEQMISEAIEKLLQNRTAIIIAHRMQSIEKVDQILVLNKGKVLEYGPKNQLEQDRLSYFYDIQNIS